MTELSPTLLPAQCIVFDDNAAFDIAYARLSGYVLSRALKIADGDRALADDLAQQARVHLWELDPSRYTAAEDGFLKLALSRRMMNCARGTR